MSRLAEGRLHPSVRHNVQGSGLSEGQPLFLCKGQAERQALQSHESDGVDSIDSMKRSLRHGQDSSFTCPTIAPDGIVEADKAERRLFTPGNKNTPSKRTP